MGKIKKINKIEVDVTIMWENDEEYNNQDTLEKLREKLGLIALCVQSTHEDLNAKDFASAKMSMMCVDSWAKELYEGIKEICEGEE